MAPEFGGHALKVLLGGFDLNHVLGVLFSKKKLTMDIRVRKDLRGCIIQYFCLHIF